MTNNVRDLKRSRGDQLAYLGNVILHPFEQLPLIQQASIEVSILLDLRTRQETESAHAVVEVHIDDVVSGLPNHMCAIVATTRLLDDLGPVIVGI